MSSSRGHRSVNGTQVTALGASLMPSRIEITGKSENVLEFDMVGTSAPVANALRRVMLDHVPTVAIEEFDVNANTGVMQDEILKGRIGLLPIKVDATKMHFAQDNNWKTNPHCCLKFTLKVGDSTAVPDPNKAFISIYSGDLVWEPLPGQRELFGKNPPRFINDKILITKIVHNDSIDVVCYARKGTGGTHAKFSPVCPVWYKMLPKVEFRDINNRPTRVAGEDAKWLKKTCPGDVFDIEDGVAVVARPRQCTACRECVRGKLADHIYLGRQQDHFIWTVESTGVYEPEDIVKEGLQWLKYHCLDNSAQLKQSAVKQHGGETAAAAAAAF